MMPNRKLDLTGPVARRLNATLVGSGDELIVFSHGLGTDQTVWKSLIAKLPPHCSALLFDLPGAGPLMPADFDPADYGSIAAYADDLLALLEEAGVDRCTYVGHSVSGMIGALASVEAPERFKRLVLINASPRYLDDEDYRGGFSKEEINGLIDFMATNYQAWVAGFATSAIAVDMPEAVEEFSAGLLSMRPDITVRITRMIFESDTRSMLPAVTTPTLVISSCIDVAVPQEVGRYLHDHIQGSELAWIQSAGHLPHLSAPDELIAVLDSHQVW